MKPQFPFLIYIFQILSVQKKQKNCYTFLKKHIYQKVVFIKGIKENIA